MRRISVLTVAMILCAFSLSSRISAQAVSLNEMQEIGQVVQAASCGKWEMIKDEKGVRIRSRWLTFDDTLRTREISTHFVVKGQINDVLINLVQPARLESWNEGIREVSVLSTDGNSWITHMVYDIPFPFSQQDMVVKNSMVHTGQKTIINISSLPDYIAPINDVNRQRHYFGRWELTSLDKETTEVVFHAISFSRSNIPLFIRDPIIQRKLLNSFIRLKELSSL